VQTQAESNRLNKNLSSNFKVREFICPCCYKEGVTDELVYLLQLAHDHLPKNSVIIITSSFRCAKHNSDPKVGGSSTSSHLKGLAADVKCSGSPYRFYLLKALIEVGFSRIGIGEDFIHVDLDRTKDQNVIWNYY